MIAYDIVVTDHLGELGKTGVKANLPGAKDIAKLLVHRIGACGKFAQQFNHTVTIKNRATGNVCSTAKLGDFIEKWVDTVP